MTKNKKLNLLIIFGGKSAEHEVSIISAKSIVNTINTKKYNIFLVGIDKQGKWLPTTKKELLSEKFVLNNKNRNNKKQKKSFIENFLIPKSAKTKNAIEVVFPILHGPFGEDGTIQGLLKILDIAFVGPGVLSSAINMDKDISKRLLKEAGLPVVKYLTFNRNQKNKISFTKIKNNLGLPFFIKPANLGSSVGINKVKDKKEFNKALKEAFLYDNKIIIEKAVAGKEIECAILGNENPKASVLGEIIPTHDFYSYQAKYLDKNGAKMSIPAKIPKAVSEKIRKLAIKSFKTLCCEGLGRVDFFLTKNNKIFVNEINTIPGFTPISMYPKLWEKSGISYSRLIDKLIKLAITRQKVEHKLQLAK